MVVQPVARVVLPSHPGLWGRMLDAAWAGFLAVFIYSSVWVALGMASLTLFAFHVLGVEVAWEIPSLVFVSGLFIYNLDHVADAQVQAMPDAKAKEYFQSGAVLVLVTLSALATGVLVGQSEPEVQWVFAGYGTIGLLYGLPVLPWRSKRTGERLRLKDVPWIKGWLVGGAITLATVGLPVAVSGLESGQMVTPLALFLFVFTATNVHMCDVRDLESDNAVGLRTLPSAAGVAGAKGLLLLLNLVLLLAMCWGWAAGVTELHPEVMIAGAFTVLYVLILKEGTDRLIFEIVCDGCFYLPALLVTSHQLLG